MAGCVEYIRRALVLGLVLIAATAIEQIQVVFDVWCYFVQYHSFVRTCDIGGILVCLHMVVILLP